MDNLKNVQIPYKLLTSLLETLEHLDVSLNAEDYKMQFDGILEALRGKNTVWTVREAYTDYKIAHGNQRNEKRIEYMQVKETVRK